MKKAPITKVTILKKVNRKKNPVQSIAGLAREFGVATTYTRLDGTAGISAPPSFRKQVKSLVGLKTYDKIRDTKSVPAIYR